MNARGAQNMLKRPLGTIDSPRVSLDVLASTSLHPTQLRDVPVSTGNPTKEPRYPIVSAFNGACTHNHMNDDGRRFNF
jgi:hypothetical protein